MYISQTIHELQVKEYHKKTKTTMYVHSQFTPHYYLLQTHFLTTIRNSG